jgi:hypothetical protein
LFIEFDLEDVIFAIIEIKLTRRSPDSHLFFDCPVTQFFLKSLSKQLKQYYKNLIFDKKEYFFGFESGDLLVNLISIIAKITSSRSNSMNKG